VQRRQFLAGMGAAAAARRLPVRATGEAERFPHGVASGDPSADGVVLWTRSEGATELRWLVALDESMEQVVAEGTHATGAGVDWTANVVADGLDPGTSYHYAFEVDGTRSPVGRTRTLPETAERFRIGVVSCSRYATAAFGAYEALAAREVDLVVHVGDYIYEDGGAGQRAHVPSHVCTTLADYRARYAQHRLDPALAALHARHPVVAVWDDHEIAGNAWRDGARDHDGDWASRRDAAVQAHHEWLPMRQPDPDDPTRIWRSIVVGDLAELVLLDTRLWGRDQQITEPEVAALADPSRTLLGEDQRAFLLDRLADTSRPWALVANQVMVNPMRLPVPASFEQAARERGLLIVDGTSINPDQWDGYPAERDRLVAAATARGGGVVVLTGDVHSSWAFEGGPFVEVVAPSVTSTPLADLLPAPAALIEAAVRATNPALRYLDASEHGYAIVDLTPERCTAEWWFVEPEDAATERFGAAFTTGPAAPMALTRADAATEDPLPQQRTVVTPPPLRPQPDGGDDGGLPIAGVAAGAAAVGAVIGAVALRRRRVD
jgi:alkaline phosphatase D